MQWSILLYILFFGLLGSCSILGFEEAQFNLETDQDVYEISDEIRIEARNNSVNTIFFSTCMPTTLERLEDGQVVQLIGFPVCYCRCGKTLKSNEKWDYTVSLSWIDSSQWSMKENTEYRIRLEFFSDEGMRRLLDEQVLYTKQFKIIQSQAGTRENDQ